MAETHDRSKPHNPEIRHLLGESRFLVASRTRKDEWHCVSYHRTSDSTYIEERCTCENFSMGIPRMIADGRLPNTIANRRCFHIKIVNQTLLFHAQKALIGSDTSQAEDRALSQRALEPGIRASA
jgi:hypothetical protein